MQTVDKKCKKNFCSSRKISKNIQKNKSSEVKEEFSSKEIKKGTKIEKKPFIFTGSESFSEISHDKYRGFTTQQMTISQSIFGNNGNNFPISYNELNDNINEEQKEDNDIIINYDIDKYESNF